MGVSGRACQETLDAEEGDCEDEDELEPKLDPPCELKNPPDDELDELDD